MRVTFGRKALQAASDIGRVVTVPGFSVFRSFSPFSCQAWVSVQSFLVPFSHNFQVSQTFLETSYRAPRLQ